MKIEVSIDLLKDFFANCDNCKGCKYKGTNCVGRSCDDAKIESLIEKSKLVLDFDSAILELEKETRKCDELEKDWLLFRNRKVRRNKIRSSIHEIKGITK